MKIKAYLLVDHAVAIQPSANERDWTAENKAVYESLSLGTANGQGWDLLCPTAFEATWNGGPNPEDVQIRLAETGANIPGFVHSSLGGGLLTFHTGYQFKTEGENTLWVRGPINRPVDGLYPLECIVDTSMLPCTITIHWKFTRPDHTVRFEQEEPFGTILPYPKHYAETFEGQVVRLAGDSEAYERELEQMLQAPAVRSVLQRLEAAGEQIVSQEQAREPQENLASLAAPVSGASPRGRGSEQAASRDQARDSQASLAAPGQAEQSAALPAVSCICPTYGRVDLLEEAIYSFLQQDYAGQKELVILNDYDRQTLAFDHPEVKIVNVPKRFHSVGEKFKAAVALCAHDLIFVWHDDDIYLPHRLSTSVAHFDPEKAFFKADKAWFWNNGQLSGPERNIFHGGSCWSRELYAEVRGYPHIDLGYDLEFEQQCKRSRSGSLPVYPIQPQDIYYIYRWAGTGSYHLSGFGQAGDEHRQVAAHVQEQARYGQIRLGEIKLNPHWKADYTTLVQDYLSSGQVKPAADEVQEPFPPPFHVISPPPPMEKEAAAGLFKGTYPAQISVILPSSNESVLLKRTVDQFQATLPAHSEVIVVDNGSTDGCADFLVDEERGNVHLIRTAEPLGVAGARNRGLTRAQGEVVVFADAHMDLPERWWQPIVTTLNRPKVGVVGPGIGVMGKPDYPVAYGQRIVEPDLGPRWLTDKPAEPRPVPTLGGGFMAMRHDTLQEAGAFDAGMPDWGSEDLELCIRYWLLGYEVWVVPEVTVLHYFRKTRPYEVTWRAVTHNLLRVAFLHFNQARIARILNALKDKPNFAEAIASAVDSDGWQQRAEFAARRVRDDDWLFDKFKDSCPI